MAIPPSFVILFILAMAFAFLDGYSNSANVVATVISSRAMRPRQALTLAAGAEFIGPFLFGTAVARTIAADLVDPDAVTVPMVAAAVLSAIFWRILTVWLGIPSSSSHSLFGGLIGAVVVGASAQALQSEGMRIITLSLLLSPIMGLIGGYIVMVLTLFLTRGASPSINILFKRGQLLTSTGLAMTYGSNNAQKVMGIVGLGLVSTGMADDVTNATWIIASAAGMLAFGTFLGGTRIIRTIGAKFYKIRPVHGFTAQATTASIILGATLLGGPVSTTQVVSSTIVGVGAAERLSKVRWHVFRDITTAWLVTLPATAVIAAALYFPMEFIMSLVTP